MVVLACQSTNSLALAITEARMHHPYNVPNPQVLPDAGMSKRYVRSKPNHQSISQQSTDKTFFDSWSLTTTGTYVTSGRTHARPVYRYW
jgi:hypothetical protein